MKQFIFALVLSGLSFSAMASSSYLCKDTATDPQTEIVNIADDGAVTIPSEANPKQFSGPVEIKVGQTDDCIPHGENGKLIENGSGPGYWVYRFPQTMLSGTAATVKAELTMDYDSDNQCTFETLSCTKQ